MNSLINFKPMNQSHFVKICQIEDPNKNTNYYTESVVKNIVVVAKRREDKGYQMMGEFGFPTRSPGISNDEFGRRVMQINLQFVSHAISDLRIENNCLVANITTLDTYFGRALKRMMNTNNPSNFRLRGFCSIGKALPDGRLPVENFKLVTVDAVFDRT